MINERLAAALRGAQRSIVDDVSVEQCGHANLDFTDAPDWHHLDEADLGALRRLDEAVIETFVADEAGLSALSDSPWLERWRPRAEAMLARVLDATALDDIVLSWPGHLTCSITPTRMLEGLPHFDDHHHQPDSGLGVVAVCGQHRSPRVASGHVPLTSPPSVGPLPVDESQLANASWSPDRPDQPDDIVLFAGFGQLHAGPAATDFGDDAPEFRQLMVLRVPTLPVEPS